MKIKKTTIAIVALAVVLAGAITTFGIVAGSNANAMGTYRNNLESVYKRSFYDLVDDVNNIELNLSKLAVATSSTIRQNYLTKICSLTNEAQSNLAILPLDHEIINETVKFVNTLGGFAFTLQQRLLTGGAITDDEMDTVEQLHATSLEIKYELNRLSVMLSGGYMIVDNVKDPQAGNTGFSSEFGSLSSQAVDYPQLIYDGPFSESITHKDIKGLDGEDVSAEEAKQKLAEWFAGYTISGGQEGGGVFDVYNFTLKKSGQTIYAQVTKKGGKLLEFTSTKKAGALNKTEEEAIQTAEKFARDTLKIDGLKAVWSTTSNGFLYVNLCYMLDESIVVYPDMIKVKVSRQTGDICGWEARSYYTNHTDRASRTPVFDPAIARASLDGKLVVLTQLMVLTPGEYVGEDFCYEFKCIYGGATYYVYVDAVTGEELKFLKVIETDDGEMFM